ncbi:unnamed protein product [Prunus brigantina]
MKLQEIMDPKSLTLRKPQVKIKTKGRPSNFDKSTRRLPSAFELVEFDCNRNSRTLSDDVVYTKPPPKKRKKQAPSLTVNRDTQSSALAIVNVETTPPKKQPPKLLAHEQQIVNLEDLTQQYNDKPPDAISPFIMGAKDVKSYGNCGFRAIARLLGYGENSRRKLHLQPHHPMPPVINRWLDISNLKVLDWYSPYRDRIDH